MNDTAQQTEHEDSSPAIKTCGADLEYCKARHRLCLQLLRYSVQYQVDMDCCTVPASTVEVKWRKLKYIFANGASCTGIRFESC